MLSALLSYLSWNLYRRTIQTDPRRLRIAVLFLLTLWFAWQTVFELISYVAPQFGVVVLICVLLAPFSVIVLAGILLRNGAKMLRKEGRSLGNSLSGLLGVVLLVLPVIGVLLLWGLHPLGVGLAVLLLWGSAQLGVSFLVFWVFSKLYARQEPREAPDAVVVLGSGLIRGKVPRLLANRLDRGRVAFDEVRAGGWDRPLLIPSGGKGPDEPRPEAEAMAEYLVQQGMDPSLVVAETRSRNTEQNLLFSRRVADEHRAAGPRPSEGATMHRYDDGPGGQLLVVTNGYHVPRTALLSRRIDVEADVVGAPTAKYFVPSAFLREFVAVLRMHRRPEIAMAVPGVLLAVFATWVVAVGA